MSSEVAQRLPVPRLPTCCVDVGLERDPFTFRDGHVAIDGEIGEALGLTARLRPLNFEPVEFGSGARSQNLAHVVRGEIAAPIVLETRALHTVGGPRDSGTDCVAIALDPMEFDAQPVVARA